jgi:spermidine/putrescine transport system substrate-binding protein
VVEGLQDPWYDTGSVYSVPYMYFGTGIAYRADRIDPAQVEEWGWDTLWNATEFKGQCSVLEDEREAFTMAMLRKGITDINTTDQAVIDQALADVTELIDLVNIKVNITGYTDIPQGVTSIAHTWSADMIGGYLNFMPAGTGPEILGFWHPPAGSYIVSNDSMGVMADAENPVLAHLYINHLLDNTVAEENFGWVGYLPALSSLDADYVIDAGYVPENLRSCVPTNDEINQALRYEPLGDGDALYEDAWSKFLAGA